jgi:catecholate siderophore receptor
VTDSTRLTRTPKGRRGESDVIQAQSDYTGNFNWLGLKHNLIAGVDFSQEEAKRNNSATDPLTNTYTTVGNPDSGTTVIDTRVIGMNTFKSQNLGIYAQDTLALNETVKLIGGMRVENFSATYRDVNGYSVSLNKTLPSPRLGAL